MKKRTKIILTILLLIFLFFLWFYSKQPVKLSVIPNKTNAMKFFPSSKDSCLVYIPYTLKINNNRIKILKLSRLIDTKFLSDFSDNTLLFDFKGNEITDYRNSEYNSGSEYYYKIYDKTIFPFCYKSLTFYRAIKVPNSEIKNFNDKLEYDKYRFNLENLNNTINYKLKDFRQLSIYDKKYEKFVLIINSQNGNAEYFVDFYLNNKQKVYELKKMSEKELKDFIYKDMRK